MLRKLTELKKRTEGFTIIEVLIVLAIAALILVIVLVAIPQLQKNQRDAARKDKVARVFTELSNYAGNNQGKFPAATGGNANAEFGDSKSADTNAFVGKYLKDIDIVDPKTGNDFIILLQAPATAAGTAVTIVADEPGELGYYTNAECNGEVAVSAGATANPRKLAVVTKLEGGGSFCQDNK